MKKIFSLPLASRKYLLPALLGLLLLLVGGWYIAGRVGQRSPASLARMVPATAIGYVEVGRLPELLERIRGTAAWRELAPLFGIEDRFETGRLSSLAGVMAGEEVAVLAESGLALVLTGIEVADDQVRPRLTLLIETGRQGEAVQARLENRWRGLAARLFGGGETIETSYAGIRMVSFHPPGVDGRAGEASRGLFVARVEGTWLLANHPDAIRLCLDTRLGRTPALTDDFYWRQSRRRLTGLGEGEEARGVAGLHGVYGFLPAEGVARLLRSGAHIVAGGGAGKALLAGAVGDLASHLAGRLGDGIAWREDFGPEGATVRTLVMLKPDLVESLAGEVKASPVVATGPGGLTGGPAGLLPAELSDLTSYRIVAPAQTLERVEAAVSARLGAGESFLLHQFLTGVRAAFPGLGGGTVAIADELVEADWEGAAECADCPGGAVARHTIWMVKVADRAVMTGLIDDYLRGGGGGAIRRQEVAGVEVLSGPDGARGAAAFIDHYLLLGTTETLTALLTARRPDGSWPAGRWAAEPAATSPPPLLTGRTREDDALRAAFRILGGVMAVDASARVEAAIARLPLAVWTVTLESQGVAPGVVVESRSPLGSLPRVVALLAGISEGGVKE